MAIVLDEGWSPAADWRLEDAAIDVARLAAKRGLDEYDWPLSPR